MNRKTSESIEENDDVNEDKEDMEVEEVDSDEWDDEGDGEAVPANDCIFCSHHSKDLGSVQQSRLLYLYLRFGVAI